MHVVSVELENFHEFYVTKKFVLHSLQARVHIVSVQLENFYEFYVT